MFDGIELSYGLAAVAATGIILILIFIKGIGSKDDGKRYPPSVSMMSLMVSVITEGVTSLAYFFSRSAEKLGPVMSCKIGGKVAIILNDKKAITEAFLRQSETFADRFEFWAEKNISNSELRGIIFARYNENFKKCHQVCLSILKEFGLGANRLSETRILQEVESMIEEIVKINGQAFDLTFLMSFSTSYVVMKNLFCEKFLSVKKNQKALMQHSADLAQNLDSALAIAPLLRFLPYFRKKIDALSQGNINLMRAINEGIEVSKADKSEPTFVSRFLEIVGSDYNQQDLAYILRDLCLGSLETVSALLLWALVELANHVEIQTRLQREIDDVVPGNRLPSLDDKPHLPYVEAVILELLRRRSVVPLIPPHTTCKDTEVLGYFIPNGSMVLANIYGAHMDSMTWKDPKNFDPERFLDKEGNVTGEEKLLPFGLGKRSCPGEILGRQKLFLFLTSLVQRFDICPPEDQDSINVREITAVAMHPSDFKVRLIPRNKL